MQVPHIYQLQHTQKPAFIHTTDVYSGITTAPAAHATQRARESRGVLVPANPPKFFVHDIGRLCCASSCL